MRQLASRFTPLGLKSVCVFVDTPQVAAGSYTISYCTGRYALIFHSRQLFLKTYNLFDLHQKPAINFREVECFFFDAPLFCSSFAHEQLEGRHVASPLDDTPGDWKARVNIAIVPHDFVAGFFQGVHQYKVVNAHASTVFG